MVDYLHGSLDLSKEGCLSVNPADMSTPILGVFAVGDMTCKKVRQTVVAAAEGCLAALGADRYIHKRERMYSQWSAE